MMLVSNQHKSHRGFTLIELMVVLVILGTMLTLVGGATVQSYEKAQAKTELMQLRNTLSALGYRGFSLGKSIIVKLEGKRLTAKTEIVFPKESIDSDEELKKNVILDKTYEYLFFQPQKIRFSRKGFAQDDDIKVFIGNREEAFSLRTNMKVINHEK